MLNLEQRPKLTSAALCWALVSGAIMFVAYYCVLDDSGCSFTDAAYAMAKSLHCAAKEASCEFVDLSLCNPEQYKLSIAAGETAAEAYINSKKNTALLIGGIVGSVVGGICALAIYCRKTSTIPPAALALLPITSMEIQTHTVQPPSELTTMARRGLAGVLNKFRKPINQESLGGVQLSRTNYGTLSAST